MSHTSREPSSKVFGYPHPYLSPPPASRVILQLHNLEHGEHWIPALEAFVLSPQILLPIAFPPQWRILNATWNIRMQASIIQNYVVWHHRPTGFSHVFLFNFFPAVQQWAMNEIKTPAGNYAFNGSATFSWTEV